MDSKKRKRLEAAGWTFGNAEDFLGMSPEEAAYLEIKLTLAREVEAQRKKAGLSQAELAAKLKTRPTQHRATRESAAERDHRRALQDTAGPGTDTS